MNSNNLVLAETVINVLRFMKIWPKNKFDFMYFVKLISVLSFCNLVVIMMMCFIKYYYNNYGFDFEDLSDPIAGSVAAILVQIYVLFLTSKQRKLHEMLIELGDFSVYEKPIGVELTNLKVNLVLEVLILWMCFSVVSAILYTFAAECQDDVVDDCGIIIKAYLPFFNIFRFPYRQIVAFIEGLNALMFAVIAISTGYVLLSIAEFLVNRLDHLKRLVKEFPKMKKYKRKAHFKKCILYHYKIIDFADRFHDITYTFFMMIITLTSITMTLILYQLILKFDYIMFVHGSLWFFYIAACCLMGERLYGCSLDLADVVYESIPWDGDMDTQKSLLLMMIRAQRPLCIPGGFEPYASHALLVSILKSSYSFITLIVD